MDAGKVYIHPVELGDAQAFLRFQLDNREFFTPFSPLRGASFFTLAGQREAAEAAVRGRAEDREYRFGIFEHGADALVGSISVSNVVRDAWQNATLGYMVAEQHNAKGYATEAVTLAVAFAFDEARLHRVQAAVMPRNVPSARVLSKVGFRREGHSPRYLQINGAWEDHDVYALTVEDWRGR